MGEMLLLLGAADICFMGGSLVGDKVGGHNVLEPAILKKVVITGPSYFNFKDIVNDLIQANGMLVSKDSAGIGNHLTHLISEPHSQHVYGQNAYEYAVKNQGALARTIKHVTS
jgi:3-deoxy-D-manno-octulosonic-acid transferase